MHAVYVHVRTCIYIVGEKTINEVVPQSKFGNRNVHTCTYIVHVYMYIHVCELDIHVQRTCTTYRYCRYMYMYNTTLHMYKETIDEKFP